MHVTADDTGLSRRRVPDQEHLVLQLSLIGRLHDDKARINLYTRLRVAT